MTREHRNTRSANEMSELRRCMGRPEPQDGGFAPMAELRVKSRDRDREDPDLRIPNNEDESYVMAQIHKYSLMTEDSLEEIENLIKKGYPMNSPEVKRLQQKLHEIEVKSNFWRNRMMKYL